MYRIVGFGLCLGLLAGCGSKTGEETGADVVPQDTSQPEDTQVELEDEDGDGFYTDEDCDDNNYLTYPGADEICDGEDNDCDKSIDEDFDADGDGQTDDALCEDGTDCDDSDDTVYSGAEETPYDGVDQDCDGADVTDVDGDGEDAEAVGGSDCNDEDASIYSGAEDEPKDGIDQDCDGSDNLDGDGDGYDDEEYGGEDCDDEDPNIRPGLFDFRDDDIDDDCDGDISTAHEFSDASVTIIGDGTYSELVGYNLAACDFDGDGLDDLVVSAPFGADYGGQVGIWYGSGADGWTSDMTMEDADTLIEGTGYAFIGFQTTCADVDGDGFEDLITERGEIHYGSTYYTDFGVLIYYGDGTEFSSSLDDGDADTEITLAMNIDEEPTVRSLPFEPGDMDGDGASELVFLLDGLAPGDLSENISVLILGGGSYSGDLQLTEEISGWMTSDQPGTMTSIWTLEDLDGDGAPDLFIGDGAYSYEFDTADTGDPYTYEGRVSFITEWTTFFGTEIADAAVRTFFGNPADYLGFSAGASDVDGDGLADLAISAVGDTAGGTEWGGGLYVVSDIAGFLGQPESDVVVDYQAHIWGEDDSGYLGWAITGMGDLNSDGYEDLLVSAPNGGSSDVGEVWVLSGELLTGDSRVDDVALLRLLGENN